MNFSELRFDRLKVLSRIQRAYFQKHTLFDRSWRALCCVQKAVFRIHWALFSTRRAFFPHTHVEGKCENERVYNPGWNVCRLFGFFEHLEKIMERELFLVSKHFSSSLWFVLRQRTSVFWISNWNPNRNRRYGPHKPRIVVRFHMETANIECQGPKTC